MSQLLIALAALGPALSAPADRQVRPDPGECRATLEGRFLVTEYRHPGGYRVTGIWTLLAVAPRQFGPWPAETITELRLESVEEWAEGRRLSIPVTLPLRRSALALDPLDALRRTVSAWCGTVREAQEAGVHFASHGGKPWWRI